MLKEKIEEKIGFVTLDNGPENLLVPSLINEIIDVCNRFDKHDDVHIIFMNSSAEKFFSNGLDPKALMEEGFEVCFQAVIRMVYELYALKKPMVACINGYALAGGAVLGILADYRFANPKLKYSFNEVLLGLTMPQILFDIIKNTVGPFHAKHLSQTGKVVKANDAIAMGLVDKIFENEQLYAHSLHFAKRLSRMSPISLRQFKKNFTKKCL